MTTSHRVATTAVFAALLLAGTPVRAQLPRDPVERARVIAEIYEANARQLTLFDREGKVVSQVGERDMYNQPVLSPDGKRLAVIKLDLQKEATNVWVLDVVTGKGVPLTSHESREFANLPEWSPDGSQVAYATLRAGNSALYRRASNGEGAEELLYQNRGGLMGTSGWSVDGRFLSFFSTDLKGGVLYALPMNPSGERTPIEIFRSQHQVQGGRLSPDSRLLAYVSNESGRNEVYVRPFEPTAAAGGAPPRRAVADFRSRRPGHDILAK